MGDDLIFVAQVGKEGDHHADNDQDDRQDAIADRGLVEGGSGVHDAGTFGGARLLVAMPLAGAVAGPLDEHGVVGPGGETLEQAHGLVQIGLIDDPDFPAAIRSGVHLILDLATVEKISEPSGLRFVFQSTDLSHATPLISSIHVNDGCAPVPAGTPWRW